VVVERDQNRHNRRRRHVDGPAHPNGISQLLPIQIRSIQHQKDKIVLEVVEMSPLLPRFFL